VQAVVFGVVLYEPNAHAAQVRSLEVVPGDDMNVPAGQLVKSVRDTAFCIANVDAGQREQDRSVVVGPGVEMKEPAGQSVHTAHATFGPGAQLPAAHGRSVVGVPSARSGPGGHVRHAEHCALLGSVLKLPGAHGASMLPAG
jgi:hypothetical protein